MNINERDRLGHMGIHRAFEEGTWKAVKSAVDQGAKVAVVTLSGASLEDFAKGLNRTHLFNQLTAYLKRKK